MQLNCHAFDEKRCRSCSLIELDYHEGLGQKVEQLKSKFHASKICSPIISPRLNGYRNKAKFVIGGTLEKPIIGIPALDSKYEVSDLSDCPIHQQSLNAIALFIRNHITEFKLAPYSIENQKGEFKYLILNIARITREISIRFGMRSLESFERVKKLSESIQANFSDVKVISFEVQPVHAAIFEGENHFLTKEKYIQHDFNSFKLYGSTSNFFQINSEVALSLYEEVYQRYKSRDISVAVDLFCGVGGFAVSISRFCKKVIAVEKNESAIACARKLEIPNIEFFCDDARKLPDYLDEKIDLLIVNPPRRGLGEEISLLINQIAPKFLVYSSCNADSLADDQKILEKCYELESIVPVDMFALTNHLEVLTFWNKQ